jgi:ATP-binding cassette subfamily B protein
VSPGLTRTLGASVRLAWRAHRWAFLGRVAVTVVAGLSPVAAAWLLRVILDDIVSPHGRGQLMTAVIVLAVVGGVQALLPSAGNYLAAQAGRAAQRYTTAELFTAVSRLAGLRRIEDPAFHDQLNLAQQAGSAAPGQIFGGGVTIVQSALTMAGFLVTLALLSPLIAVIVLVAAVPGLFTEVGISRQRVALISGLSHAQRRQYFYANLLTDYAAAKEIRLFGLGAFFKGRMLDELRRIQQASQRVDRRQLAVYTGLALLGGVIAAGGLLWAGFAAEAGRLSVGNLSIFIVALGSVTSSLNSMVMSAAMTYQSVLMFRSYQGVVNQGPDLPSPPEPAPAPPLRRGIEFQDVWFRYAPDQPWVLRGVSLVIPYGQALAIVGHNGAGKSTLAKLLCRLYDPDQGRILWDGRDVCELDLGSLRDHISVVFQDFMSYELSAADNIAVGDLRQAGDRQALTAAATRAGVHDALASLPAGYDTMLTRMYFDLADRDDPRTGVLLSGGQWQRLGLARALLRADRDLLILDEPSSGLDAEAEYEIHQSMREDRRRHATVLISHRLNTVRDADHIVVLAEGMISEQGSHDALMAEGGVYARLFSLQASGYVTEPVGGSHD